MFIEIGAKNHTEREREREKNGLSPQKWHQPCFT